jgi:4-amino-4-deoxy-L-arabinose transferase-like glycosyltransferase
MRARTSQTVSGPEQAHRDHSHPHRAVAVVLAAAAILLFVNLGRDRLWADEGDTAVLGRSILSAGVPTAWDGVSFTDSDYGARVNDDFVMVSHPWLQYYVVAGSFAVFGANAWAARFPFALLGLLTIGLVYWMGFRLAQNRMAGLAAAILLTASVQFLVFSRQSRYYALTAALTCLLIVVFLRLRSWRGVAAFSAVAVAAFHSHPAGLAAYGALGVLAWTDRHFRDVRAWFLRSIPFVLPLTIPWILISRSGYAENTQIAGDLGTFFARLGQYGIEWASVTSVVGALVLFFVARRRVRPKRLFTVDERNLVAAMLAVVAGSGALMALTLSRDSIWTFGVRYTSVVLPFGAILTGLAIAKASRLRWLPFAALVMLFAFTRAGQITPWTFWEKPVVLRDPDALVTFHNPARLVDRLVRTTQAGFVRSLFEPNGGTLSNVAGFLNGRAGRGDVVITNYEWEPLYFHTGLPLGMTVLSSYPIWRTAQEHGLPSYVFTPRTARWIVWRRAWGAYRGQACERIIDDLRADGARVVHVASFRETLWENRENIHFRRFPGNRYYYGWYPDMPETSIFQVDWPATSGANPGT